MKRADRCRLYPTQERATELSRPLGCARRALDARAAWRQEQRRVGYTDTSALLTAWKQTDERSFRAEVSSVLVRQSLPHQQQACTRSFGKQAGYPRFGSRKKSRAPAECTRSGFRWRCGRLALDRLAPTAADAGPTSLLTLSTGEKVGTPRHEHRERVALARAQRNLARKTKGSNNRAKVRVKAAHTCARTADRRDPQHTPVIAMDRWFPSSETRSRCGHLLDALPLSPREWICPGYGDIHDRDAKRVVAARADGVGPSRR